MADVELDVTFESSNVSLDTDFGSVYVIDGDTAVKVIANKYSSERTYAVGEYVIHESLLYKCITAIDTPEEFDSEKWLNIKLADDVQSVKSALDTKANASDLANKMDKDNPRGTGSFAVGGAVTASGAFSHAEGFVTTAKEKAAHAEGVNSVAWEEASHAEGYQTNAMGKYSHSEGKNTVAYRRSQHVFGEYNITDDEGSSVNDRGEYVEIAGNGTSNNPSNARTLDWNGNETLAGNLTFNGNTSLTGEISRLDGRIDNLPNPMIFKGTLGENGTITSLPNASASNAGHTYKVITEGTYAGQEAKVGDTFTSAKPVGASEYSWILFSEGDTDTDTWRAIKVNGTEKLSSGISSGAVDFVDTDNIEVTFDTTGNKVKIATKNIYTQTQVDTAVANKANKNNPVITGSLAMNKSSAYSLGSYATTLGYMGRASGYASTSIGMGNQAVGSYSTAIGYGSTSAGIASTAIGDHVDAKNRAQLVFGQFNIADPSTESGSSRGTYVEIVGNGTGFDFETGQENHSNARTLDWRGNEWLAGDLTINGNVSLANKINTYDSIIGNSLSATLTAGQTSVTIQDASITAGSILSVFTDVYGLQPLSVSATTGSVTLTFTAQGVDIHIKVEVK